MLRHRRQVSAAWVNERLNKTIQSASQVENLSGNKSLKLVKKRLSTSVKVRPFNVIN